MIWSLVLCAAVKVGEPFDLRWYAEPGASIELRVRATSNLQGNPIDATAVLYARAAKVVNKQVVAATVTTSGVSLRTRSGPSNLPNGGPIVYDMVGDREDPSGLGIFSNVPMYLLRPLASKPVTLGQSWVRPGGGKYKAMALEKFGTVGVLRVALTADSEARDQVDGTYWISTKDGSIVRANIHTKSTVVDGETEERVAAEWNILVDRIEPAPRGKQ